MTVPGSTPALFDSHAHLDDAAFAADFDAMLGRARAAGVVGTLVPAIDLDSWEAIAALCRRHADLHPAWGLHPLLLERHRPEHLDALRGRLERDRPNAVGECGLDFYVDGLDPDTQRIYFRRQLELARDFDLPVVVHARRAVEEVTLAIRQVGGLRGVVHSFAGSAEQARQLFDLGFLLGIGGPVTYERARKLQAVVRDMPLGQLLLETDAPDQPLHGHQGQRNEPARLPDVLAAIARLRDESPESIATATTANARRLFGLDGG
jgi:TatD DNase family protein